MEELCSKNDKKHIKIGFTEVNRAKNSTFSLTFRKKQRNQGKKNNQNH